MPQYVEPKAFWVGQTVIRWDAVKRYLAHTDNEEFLTDIADAQSAGISEGEILVSLFAKLCYKSLTPKHNDNISKTRGIGPNLENCYEVGHGSVFEHCSLNFIATDVSRVFTHELVRHRVGSAYSQTSGRYVRSLPIGFVEDPILDPVHDLGEELLGVIEDYYQKMVDKMGIDEMKDFGRKKKITSALRRFLPNGQANEIAFSINIRTLRHLVQTRTSRHAEWEIRKLFEDVYLQVKKVCPLMFHGATEETIEGAIEVSGMKMQPYDLVLADVPLEAFEAEANRRDYELYTK